MAITIRRQNGDAQADLQYQLSSLEESVVFLHITNPATELQNALNENLNIPAIVEQAGSLSADLTVPSFATVSGGPGAWTMTTPAFSLARAQQVAE